ncbi:hypothetical protein CC1G_15203 [Coprinopsis cinerea okayama7|uniref:Uncharacterized protein n=1 Tax=Coprinopsis cinerea (strain Okayama-7 / 130 / ATCC MYA-4618 / FGSC 9003) TaxID=240176 RepID=D6RPT6_COPC7|nr:hypothetical protein CC1G_15203 [Coprinopsis cinerea okayama7\|eukprot:XP_002910568.1 hypothetical protein CC1G_15203 [Coprinopsis cinerea okayama7\
MGWRRQSYDRTREENESVLLELLEDVNWFIAQIDDGLLFLSFDSAPTNFVQRPDPDSQHTHGTGLRAL